MTTLAYALTSSSRRSTSHLLSRASWGKLMLVDSVRWLAHGIHRLFVPAW